MSHPAQTINEIDKLKSLAVNVRSLTLPERFHTENFLKAVVDDEVLYFIIHNPRQQHVKMLAYECHTLACKREKLQPLGRKCEMLYQRFGELAKAEYQKRNTKSDKKASW